MPLHWFIFSSKFFIYLLSLSLLSFFCQFFFILLLFFNGFNILLSSSSFLVVFISRESLSSFIFNCINLFVFIIHLFICLCVFFVAWLVWWMFEFFIFWRTHLFAVLSHSVWIGYDGDFYWLFVSNNLDGNFYVRLVTTIHICAHWCKLSKVSLCLSVSLASCLLKR